MINVTDPAYGADPTGTADSTAAFRAAAAAKEASLTGEQIYIPAGCYITSGQMNLGGAKAFRIQGEGQQCTQIRMQGGGANFFNIAQGSVFGDGQGTAGTFEMDGLSFYNDTTCPGGFGATNIAVYLSGVNQGRISNVGVYQGPAAQKVNQAIVQNGCNQVVVDNCDLHAIVNAVAYEGYCQVNTVRDSHLWTSSNPAGASSTGAVLCKGQTLGFGMRHVICHDGDRGFLAAQDSTGQQPHLFEFYEVETNNHTIAHFDFEYGLHATLLGCLLSGANVANNPYGVVFGDSFQGDGTLIGCSFIGVPGHSASVRGGQGYTFSGCNFGGSGSYKYAANAYDELNVSAGVSNISALSCHFNMNKLLGMGTSMAPRAAINAPGTGIQYSSNLYMPDSAYGSGHAVIA